MTDDDTSTTPAALSGERMPTLDWIGKQAVVNHHREVPYRLVHCDGAPMPEIFWFRETIWKPCARFFLTTQAK